MVNKPPIEETAKIMHLMSKALGVGKRKIWGMELNLGIPESEFLEFLEDPESYIEAYQFDAMEAHHGEPEFSHKERVTMEQVIMVARALCVASKFYNANVCPYIGG